MLRVVSELKGYKIDAVDGEIGKVKDFLFDDEQWTVRYMVADTGGWLSERKVLISPVSCEKPDWEEKTFPVNITRKQVEESPPLEEKQPVSRRHEMEHLRYFSWPYYWVGGKVWGFAAAPAELRSRKGPPEKEAEEAAVATMEETHLRSIDEVIGYHILASDGEIGHVEDFVMDDELWIIRYMAVDTRNWLPGKQVLVPPDWIEKISWESRRVEVDMSREAIKKGPEFEPHKPVNREYETRLYDYYGRPYYWDPS